MNIQKTVFEGSFPTYGQLPAPSLPEFAFWGRSNVGKSSLINMLTRQKQLARTSRQPGRTRTFNLYRINDQWRITDLPGLGYARVSIAQRRRWEQEIWRYLHQRTALTGMLYLVDSRIPPQRIDLDTLQRLLLLPVPLTIAFTKIDKLSRNQLAQSLQRFKAALKKTLAVIPMIIPVSVVSKEGQEELLRWISEQLGTE